jgi:predicted enzyme involved in methoxymalonyl-ACP biosynthesis
MSCRVLGRGVEHAMLNELVARAAARGIREIAGEYIPSARNGMVADLFARLGFAPVERGAAAAAEPAGTRWVLRVAEFTQHPTFIAADPIGDGLYGESGPPAAEHRGASRGAP